jgi:16S rRNA (cytidine1402-2'-O)-methyltransferase
MAKLFVVPTPIGNFEDMTFRAINVLKEVDFILAEDTRTSGKLLKKFEISNKLMAYHKFNEHKAVENLIPKIELAESVALISDAGTPAISDPGYLLVKACVDQGIEIECLPGATAFVPALVNSGLPNNKFCFEGFLPQKKGRNKALEALKEEERTVVFYESPHRLIKALGQFIEFFGEDRQVSVSREISKMFEETVRGTLAEVKNVFEQKQAIKGEFVIVLAGKEKKRNFKK